MFEFHQLTIVGCGNIKVGVRVGWGDEFQFKVIWATADWSDAMEPFSLTDWDKSMF